jgi:hypothetical protein
MINTRKEWKNGHARPRLGPHHLSPLKNGVGRGGPT